MFQVVRKGQFVQCLSRCVSTAIASNVTEMKVTDSSVNQSKVNKLKVTETQVNKNIRFVKQATITETPRPLVIILGWLFAKPKYLQKYTDIYLNEGFDVMHIQVHLNQLLVSKRVQTMMKGVLDFCQDGDRKSQPVFVHGFSVGGYVYAELLVHTFLNHTQYGKFPDRLCGHIFDSPVDFTNIPRGVARASTNNPILQGFIKSSLEMYLKSAKESSKDYIRASKAWKANDNRVPTKIIYSLSDPVCEPELIESIVADWIKRGIDAESEFWEKAPHVSVYRNYPDEYRKTVIDFIRRNRPSGAADVVENQSTPFQTTN